MEGTVLNVVLFVAATFTAALVAGLTGFAFGLVAGAVWLHILNPLETALLIIASGLMVQGYAVWKLRKALRWSRLWPFLVGSAIGVAVGTVILVATPAKPMRMVIGGFLVLYCIYSLLHPTAHRVTAGGAIADAGAGVLNGIVGGATGLAGIVVVIWCTLRNWPKDEQRAVFQPVAVATFVMAALGLGMQSAVSAKIIWLFIMGLPALLLGTWLGLRFYGRLDEARFRKIVLFVLLLSGVALLFGRPEASWRSRTGIALVYEMLRLRSEQILM